MTKSVLCGIYTFNFVFHFWFKMCSTFVFMWNLHMDNGLNFACDCGICTWTDWTKHRQKKKSYYFNLKKKRKKKQQKDKTLIWTVKTDVNSNLPSHREGLVNTTLLQMSCNPYNKYKRSFKRVIKNKVNDPIKIKPTYTLTQLNQKVLYLLFVFFNIFS